MADNRSQFPQRKKNALDNRKLGLSTKCPTDSSKWSSLMWGIYTNQPRITVYTNDPSEQGAWHKGKIEAKLDAPTFFAFMKVIRMVIDAPLDTKYKIENKNFIFPGGKRSESPVHVSDLWAGKDKDGVIWIGVMAVGKDKDRPKIKFPIINPSEYHNLYHGDGTPFTQEECSKMYAEGYVTMLELLMAELLVVEYKEPEQRDGNDRGGRGQGGGGNYNRGNDRGNDRGGRDDNRRGGNDDYDDEIPF